MTDTDITKIAEVFKHQLGIFSEDIQHKLDLVVEGQQMLAEKLDGTRDELKTDIARVDYRLTVVEARLDQKITTVEQKVDAIEQKVDAVAVDLAAHRRDTEAHRGYRVSE